VLRVVSHIHDLMTRAMKDGVHYGKLPGCPKPILYQPGADKLLLTFRLVPRYEVQDLSTADCAHFRITCSLYTMEGQVYLSSAIGECSSDEDKYQWRRAVCDAEYHMVFNNDPAKARIKWVRGSNDPYSIYMVKVPCADVANTILAMAEKRAKVRAVRSALAASDIFDVNLEDIAPELRQGLVEDEEHAPSGDDRDRAERAFREQRARSLGVETPGMAGKDEYDIPLTFGAHSGKSIRMLADSAPGTNRFFAPRGVSTP
jgi:hypothetical protein